MAASSREVCQGTRCAPSPAREAAGTVPRGWQAEADGTASRLAQKPARLPPGLQESEAVRVAFNRLRLPLASYL